MDKWIGGESWKADAGVVGEPAHVDVARSALDGGDMQHAGNRRFGSAVFPFVNFRMAIGKADSAGAVVVAGRTSTMRTDESGTPSFIATAKSP